MERIDGSGNIVERRDYAGSFVFEGERLTEVLTEEGRLIPSRAVKPDFFVRDHLGSVRAVVSGDGRVLEANSYYPYGMKIDALSSTNYTSSDVPNRYKYNGKELFEDLQWLNYGARFYDAAVGRWWVRDPKAEKGYGWSSYRYGFDNPVSVTDPDGRLEDDYKLNQDGSIEFVRANKEKDILYATNPDGSINKSDYIILKYGTLKNSFVTERSGYILKGVVIVEDEAAAEKVFKFAAEHFTEKTGKEMEFAMVSGFTSRPTFLLPFHTISPFKISSLLNNILPSGTRVSVVFTSGEEMEVPTGLGIQEFRKFDYYVTSTMHSHTKAIATMPSGYYSNGMPNPKAKVQADLIFASKYKYNRVGKPISHFMYNAVNKTLIYFTDEGAQEITGY